MADQPLPKDDPRLKAWERYKASEEFANSERWAKHVKVEVEHPHLDGSMWAVFLAGFEAGKAETEQKFYAAESEASNG